MATNCGSHGDMDNHVADKEQGWHVIFDSNFVAWFFILSGNPLSKRFPCQNTISNHLTHHPAKVQSSPPECKPEWPPPGGHSGGHSGDLLGYILVYILAVILAVFFSTLGGWYGVVSEMVFRDANRCDTELHHNIKQSSRELGWNGGIMVFRNGDLRACQRVAGSPQK